MTQMKAEYVEKRLKKMGKDADWLADQVGVKRVTMKQNYMRGITPSKPVAILMKTVLKCQYGDFLHPNELEALSLAEGKAS